MSLTTLYLAAINIIMSAFVLNTNPTDFTYFLSGCSVMYAIFIILDKTHELNEVKA